jgi:hypothetical protein
MPRGLEFIQEVGRMTTSTNHRGPQMTTNPTPLMQQLDRDFESTFGPLTDEQMEEGNTTEERR